VCNGPVRENQSDDGSVPDYPIYQGPDGSVYFSYVCSLKPLGALYDLKFNRITLVQDAISLAQDCGVVNEHVGTIIPPQEAIPSRVVEPYYRAKQFLLPWPTGVPALRPDGNDIDLWAALLCKGGPFTKSD